MKGKPYLFIWIAFAVLLAFFWIYFPTLSRYRELKMEEDRMAKELFELDSKIKALQEERDLLQNDLEYLEKVIRKELGLVKPGEMVYKFVTDEMPAATSEGVGREEARNLRTN